MRLTTGKDLEALVPGLAETRAAERQNRAIAFLGLTREVCGVPLVPFTPRLRLALATVENGLLRGEDGTPEDVFQVLWHLSPWWERREAEDDGQRTRAEGERIRLQRLVAKWSAAGVAEEMARQVRGYLASQFADPPELSDDAEASPDYSDHVSWFAIEASFWLNIHGGFTLESYARTPYLVLQQLRRAWKVNNPDRERLENGDVIIDHPTFRNASDTILADIHVAQRAVIAAAIRAQTTRLPT